MTSADRRLPPPLPLRPGSGGPDWRRAALRWRRTGTLVAVADRADWGPGRAGSRALVAAVLGGLLGLDPERIGLDRDDRRRPYPVDLAGGARLPADVNVSHTEDLLVIGVSRHGRIGVDVERADRDIAAGTRLLGRFCHPAERRALAALPAPARTDAVARLWVGKEAYAKADGRGLALDFATLRIDRHHPGWRLTTVRLPAGYWIGCALHERPRRRPLPSAAGRPAAVPRPPRLPGVASLPGVDGPSAAGGPSGGAAASGGAVRSAAAGRRPGPPVRPRPALRHARARRTEVSP